MTDRYKLVHFYATPDDYWELFDLQKDPHELRSVFGQSEYAETQKTLEQEVKRLRTELKVPESDPAWVFGGKRPGQYEAPTVARSRATLLILIVILILISAGGRNGKVGWIPVFAGAKNGD